MNNYWCLKNLVQLIRPSPSINWVIMHKLLNSLTFTFVFGVSFKTKAVLCLLLIEIKGRRLILPVWENPSAENYISHKTCLHNHFENLLPLLLTRSVQNCHPAVFTETKRISLLLKLAYSQVCMTLHYPDEHNCITLYTLMVYVQSILFARVRGYSNQFNSLLV